MGHVGHECSLGCCTHRPITRANFLRGAIGAAGLLVAATAGPLQAAEEVHWEYEGAGGPENWGKLSPEFAICGTGSQQSPIDIPTNAVLNPADLVFNYRPSALNIVNNGHTVQVNYDPGSALQVDGTSYALAQYHFHARSEHAFNGKLADMELHLVHRSADGRLAVVGILMNRGADNAAYGSTMTNLPAKEGPAATIAGTSVNAIDLLPRERTYYRYAGSLTTPPCSEGVKWLVMSNPVQVADAQVANFQKIFAKDNRPLQPLNARSFLLSSAIVPTQLPRTGVPMLGVEALAGFGILAAAGGLLLRGRGARA